MRSGLVLERLAHETFDIKNRNERKNERPENPTPKNRIHSVSLFHGACAALLHTAIAMQWPKRLSCDTICSPFIIRFVARPICRAFRKLMYIYRPCMCRIRPSFSFATLRAAGEKQNWCILDSSAVVRAFAPFKQCRLVVMSASLQENTIITLFVCYSYKHFFRFRNGFSVKFDVMKRHIHTAAADTVSRQLKHDEMKFNESV